MGDGKKAHNHAERLKWGLAKYQKSWKADGGFPACVPDGAGGRVQITVHLVLMWSCSDGPMMVRAWRAI